MNRRREISTQVWSRSLWSDEALSVDLEIHGSHEMGDGGRYRLGRYVDHRSGLWR